MPKLNGLQSHAGKESPRRDTWRPWYGGGRGSRNVLAQPPSSSWADLVAWTCEHGHRAVCGADLVGDQLDDIVIELEAVVEVGSESG